MPLINIPQRESFPIGAIFIGTDITDPHLLLGYGQWQLIGIGEIQLA